MSTSYNGWPASKTLATRVIEPVKGCKLRVADDDTVVEIFNYLVKQFHARVDDVTKPHPADDWGYNYRANVNNPSQLSNHSSGTAIDLDATEHPNKVATHRTFTPKQIAEVHQILDELGGLVRWGGDYTNTPDAMHFELLYGPKKTKEIWAKIRKQPVKTPGNPRKTITQLVNEVLAGEWGNGVDRKKRLIKAGYDYDRVQAGVQRRLNAKKSVTAVAKEVLAGKWGHGAVRRQRLRAAGYDYDAVQKEVNRLL